MRQSYCTNPDVRARRCTTSIMRRSVSKGALVFFVQHLRCIPYLSNPAPGCLVWSVDVVRPSHSPLEVKASSIHATPNFPYNIGVQDEPQRFRPGNTCCCGCWLEGMACCPTQSALAEHITCYKYIGYPILECTLVSTTVPVRRGKC